MARVWNNVTNLENLSNRTILQLLQNQNELLQEFAKQIERIEGIANTAVGTANNAAAVASQAVAGAEAAKETAREAVTTATQAGVQAAQAVNVANNAVSTASDALNKVNEYEPQVDGAVTAANEAKTAANSAVTTAGAANQSANQALTKVADLSDDVETNATNIQTAQGDITAIEGREAGYGKNLSISGNTLSLMHDATSLSTVTLPGGGSEVVIHELSGWKVKNQTTTVNITNAYAVELSSDIWYIFGKILHASPLSGNVSVQIVPPDDWGTPVIAIGHADLGKAASYSRTLPIISGPSGLGSGVIGVVPAPAAPGGIVDYDSESLYTFEFIVSKAAT